MLAIISVSVLIGSLQSFKMALMENKGTVRIEISYIATMFCGFYGKPLIHKTQK